MDSIHTYIGTEKLGPAQTVELWNYGMTIMKLSKQERDDLAQSLNLAFDRDEKLSSFRALLYRKAYEIVKTYKANFDDQAT